MGGPHGRSPPIMRTFIPHCLPATQASTTTTPDCASPRLRPHPVWRCAYRACAVLATLAAISLLSACGGGGGGTSNLPANAVSGSAQPPTAATTPAAASAHYASVSILGLPPDRAITLSDGLQSGTVHGSVNASFTRPLEVGALYRLRIVDQPAGYTCSAKPDMAPVAAASAATTLTVRCEALPPAASAPKSAPEPAKVALGYRVQGLPRDLSVTLDDGYQRVSVPGQASGEISAAANSASRYWLAVSAQPANYDCSVSAGTQARAPGSQPVAGFNVTCRALKLGYTLSQDGSVKAWAVAKDGALSPLPVPALKLGGRGVAMVMAPNKAHMYALLQGSLKVLQVQADGQLEQQLGLPLPAGARGTALAMTPDGSTLFVAEQGLDLIEAFRLDPSTGAPTLLGAVGTIRPKGQLRTAKTATTLNAGQLKALAPVTLRVDPSGKYLFMADTQGRIEGFRIQASAAASAARGGTTSDQAPDLAWRATIEPFSRHADGLLAVAGSGTAERLLALDTRSNRILQLPMPDGQSAKHWKAAKISLLMPHAQAIAFDPQTSSLYVATHYRWVSTGQQARIDEWSFAATDGDGPTLESLMHPQTSALKFASIKDLVVSADGKTLYALDSGQHMIRTYRVQQHAVGNMLLRSNSASSNAPIERGLLHAGSTALLTSGIPVALVLPR